jgi:hypothetical protein
MRFAPFAFLNAGTASFVAIGGTSGSFTSGSTTYYYHKFTSSVNFYVVAGEVTSASVFLVGGGGGSSVATNRGAGGGGVLLTSSFSLTAGQTYNIYVGAGGTGGNNGETSSFVSPLGFTAYAGGGEGAGTSGYPQSNAAGADAPTPGTNYGGGGGAGAVGGDYGPSSGGRGGNGLIYNINGTATYYGAGGGGKSATGTPGAPGLIGGGTGSTNTTNATSGSPNTGGGAGGGTISGVNGGSGIVYVLYPALGPAPAPVTQSVAEKFITATGITGSTATAITTFVSSLESANLLSKFDVIYPFVGNSSTAYAYNLINTGSYYADWGNVGSIRFIDTEGITFPGTSGTYMNTKYNVTNLSRSNYHMSYYKRRGTITGDNLEMGAYNEATQQGIYMASEFQTSNNTLSNGFMTLANAVNNNAAPSTGSFMITGDSTHTSLYKGSTQVNAAAWTDSGAPNSGSIAFGAMTRLQDAVTSPNYHVYYASGSYGMATLGQQISGSDATNFYNAVQAFQTSIGRQV